MSHGALLAFAAVLMSATVTSAQKQDPVVAHVIRSALNEENQSNDNTVLVNLLHQVVSARLDDEDRSSRAQDYPVAHNLIRVAIHPAEYAKEKEEKRSAIIAAHDAVQELKSSVIRNRDQNKAIKVPLPDMRKELKLGMEMEHIPNSADTIMHDVVRQALTSRLVDEHRIARAKGGAFIHKLLRQVLQSGMEREDSKADAGILPPINHYVVREALKAALNSEDKPTSTSKAMHDAVQNMLKVGIQVEHGPRSGLKRIHEAIQNTLKAAGLEVEPYGLTHRVALSKGTRAVTQARLNDEDNAARTWTGGNIKLYGSNNADDDDLAVWAWTGGNIKLYGSNNADDDDLAARTWTGGDIKLYGPNNADDEE